MAELAFATESEQVLGHLYTLRHDFRHLLSLLTNLPLVRNKRLMTDLHYADKGA